MHAGNIFLHGAPSASPWMYLALLGGLRVERPNEAPVTRFQTQKTAALLAYLALYRTRAHGRELLIDLFWPDATREDGSRSFRTALASLRRQLEPPGTPTGAILIADRTTVRLNAAHVDTDLARFEAACLAAPISTPEGEENRLDAALAWYGGPLLPGFYDDWVLRERERMADLYRDLLLRRSSHSEQQGGLGVALDYARRAVNLEQDRAAAGTEEIHQTAHIAVIRLLARAGRPDDARRHYDALSERLRDLYDEAPSPAARMALALLPDSPETTPTGTRTDLPPEVGAPLPPKRAERLVRLPLTLTRFFGRAPEQDRLASAFADPGFRLVTLSGPGGSGKTRLAVEWARLFSEAFPVATICFVPLADLAQARYLWLAIAHAMGLERLSDPGAVYAQVCEALNGLAAKSEPTQAGAELLLILDNFEAWVDEGAPLVESLLLAVPALRLLITSRRRLQIQGEREIPIGPLPVPNLPCTPDRLLDWASVQLFIDRAQAARPDFQITSRNADMIAALCLRLEGIPLALELTAAWAGALSIAQMLERLNAHLLDEAGPPLAHQRAQRPSRHRTLRAAINTSFSLLPADLQTAFRRLSVFRGGWTLEAAESALHPLPSSAADVLARLRERSLVVAETGADGDSLRFRLLDTLREFAAEALEAKERDTAQSAHAAHYLQVVETAAPQLGGAEARTYLNALETEHDNIRAALLFLLGERRSMEEGMRLAGAMAPFWNLRGYWEEGIALLNRALDLAGDGPERSELRALVLLGKGKIAYQQGNLPVARAVYEEALTIWREKGDEAQIGTLLLGLAGIAFHADSDFERARILIEECLALRRRLEDQAGIAVALAGLGSIAEERGDYEEARSYLTECLERERELGNQEQQANLLYNLGNIAYHEDRLDEAQTLYQESLRIQRDLGNMRCIGYCWQGLGNVATSRSDYTDAYACYETALQIARQLGETWAIAILLNNLGKLAYHENDLIRAKSLCGDSLQMRAAMGDQAGAARVLENLALIADARPGTRKRAAALWGAAHGLRQRLHVPISENLRLKQDEPLIALRLALGEKAFEAAWAQGIALSFDEMLAFALQ